MFQQHKPLCFDYISRGKIDALVCYSLVMDLGCWIVGMTYAFRSSCFAKPKQHWWWFWNMSIVKCCSQIHPLAAVDNWWEKWSTGVWCLCQMASRTDVAVLYIQNCTFWEPFLQNLYGLCKNRKEGKQWDNNKRTLSQWARSEIIYTLEAQQLRVT